MTASADPTYTVLLASASHPACEAIARELSARGMALVIVDHHEMAGRLLTRSIQRQGGRAEYVYADLLRPDQMQGMLAAALEPFDTIHGCVFLPVGTPTQMMVMAQTFGEAMQQQFMQQSGGDSVGVFLYSGIPWVDMPQAGMAHVWRLLDQTVGHPAMAAGLRCNIIEASTITPFAELAQAVSFILSNRSMRGQTLRLGITP